VGAPLLRISCLRTLNGRALGRLPIQGLKTAPADGGRQSGRQRKEPAHILEKRFVL